MFRRLATAAVTLCLLLALGAVAAVPSLAALSHEPVAWKGGENGLFKDVGRPALVGSAPPVLHGDGSAGAEATPLSARRVVIVIHGVNDDGENLWRRIKNGLTEGRPESGRPEVYLFRWTKPDGTRPDLAHARSSLADLEKKYPDSPEWEAGYQAAVARRLRDFLAGARALYAEYGVDGKVDIVAHSQGSLITLKALQLGADADNLVFLGSPLLYTGERQDDVADALPHVRGVVYNYYTRSDLAIRVMGGGWLVEPQAWPDKDLPGDKVVQTCLDVKGHTGYYTEEAVRANYRDKLGAPRGTACRLPADKAKEFTGKWRKLLESAKLIEPEAGDDLARTDLAKVK